MLRKPPLLFSALLLILLSAASSGQSPSTYHYLIPTIDRLDTPAGRPVGIPIFLENKDTNAVRIDVSLQGDPSFSIDPVGTPTILYPGMKEIFVVNFMQMAMGSYQTLLRVTDGIVTDTMTLTVDVTAGSGSFVILPPFQNLNAEVGTPLQIPVMIQNLTTTHYDVTVQLHGAQEFTYQGSPSISIPDSGGASLLIDFLASEEGAFGATLVVSDGTFSDSTEIFVIAYRKLHKYAHPIIGELETYPGTALPFSVFVTNLSANPVTLRSTISGAGFTLDQASSSVVLPPGQGDDIRLSFESQTIGQYTGLLLITDGIVTDSVVIVVNVVPGPGNFDLQPKYSEFYVRTNEAFSGFLSLQGFTPTTQRLQLSMVGDPEFTLSAPSTMDLEAFGKTQMLLNFVATRSGRFSVQVMVTDGIETDTAIIAAYVDSTSMDFMLTFDGSAPFFPFETALNGTQSKQVVITNTSGHELNVNIDLRSDGSFTVNKTTVTLPIAGSDSVLVTFSNTTGFGDGMLVFSSDQQQQDLYLMGSAPKYYDYDGLRVTNMLDFGILDSAMTACLDVIIENNTPSSITISDIALSGFSNSFFLSQADNAVIDPGQFHLLTVCYRPLTADLIENEVLTFTFNNPASNPNVQTATVQLTGRSQAIISPVDSSGIAGWYVNTISAPLDASAEARIELFNTTSQAITIEHAVWIDGNDAGIYSLETPLPFTIHPHSSSLPNSGKKEITIRYAPTSQSSIIGVPDFANLSLETSTSGANARFLMTIIGIPVTPSAPGGSVALFPKDRSIPLIELGSAEVNTIRTLKFYNNLDVPVTISGYELESSARIELVDVEASHRSRTLEPNETMQFDVRTISVPSNKTTDQLIMNGSHAHLNSRYGIISGTSLTDVEQPNERPNTFSVKAAPNPSSGPVSFAFSSPLRESNLSILNALGLVVMEQQDVQLGWHWNGTTAAGTPAVPGVYFIRVTGKTIDGVQVSAAQKMVLTR